MDLKESLGKESTGVELKQMETAKIRVAVKNE